MLLLQSIKNKIKNMFVVSTFGGLDECDSSYEFIQNCHLLN